MQTNDAHILENGTGFISDIGMCGAYDGVLGFEKHSVMNKTLYGDKSRFELDEHATPMVNAVVIDVDEISKRCREIFPIYIVGKK